jgi:hypothetical protein
MLGRAAIIIVLLLVIAWLIGGVLRSTRQRRGRR